MSPGTAARSVTRLPSPGPEIAVLGPSNLDVSGSPPTPRLTGRSISEPLMAGSSVQYDWSRPSSSSQETAVALAGNQTPGSAVIGPGASSLDIELSQVMPVCPSVNGQFVVMLRQDS